jgi:hypothetical protein
MKSQKSRVKKNKKMKNLSTFFNCKIIYGAIVIFSLLLSSCGGGDCPYCDGDGVQLDGTSQEESCRKCLGDGNISD